MARLRRMKAMRTNPSTNAATMTTTRPVADHRISQLQISFVQVGSRSALRERLELVEGAAAALYKGCCSPYFQRVPLLLLVVSTSARRSSPHESSARLDAARESLEVLRLRRVERGGSILLGYSRYAFSSSCCVVAERRSWFVVERRIRTSASFTPCEVARRGRQSLHLGPSSALAPSSAPCSWITRVSRERPCRTPENIAEAPQSEGRPERSERRGPSVPSVATSRLLTF